MAAGATAAAASATSATGDGAGSHGRHHARSQLRAGEPSGGAAHPLLQPRLRLLLSAEPGRPQSAVDGDPGAGAGAGAGEPLLPGALHPALACGRAAHRRHPLLRRGRGRDRGGAAAPWSAGGHGDPGDPDQRHGDRQGLVRLLPPQRHPGGHLNGWPGLSARRPSPHPHRPGQPRGGDARHRLAETRADSLPCDQRAQRRWTRSCRCDLRFLRGQRHPAGRFQHGGNRRGEQPLQPGASRCRTALRGLSAALLAASAAAARCPAAA